MKKSMLLLMVLLCAAPVPGIVHTALAVDTDTTPEKASVQTAEQPDHDKKNDASQSLLPTQTKNASSLTMYASLTGALGIAYPMGNIAGDGGEKGLVGKSSSVGLLYGYKFFSFGSAYFKVSYTEKEIVTEYTYLNQKSRMELHTAFFDFTLAYRGFYSIFYYDAGLYYGVVFGNWSKKESRDGVVTSEITLHGPYKSRAKNEFGFLIGCGLLVPVTEHVDLQLGFELLISANTVYKDDDGNKLGVVASMVSSGIVYKW